ncbi:MAG TPA: hypothetical protein VMI31_17485 [Fimbriimonadaceae bacterium]|nr:hypothetical protein [Fimbriimonadaceae bacterium]
MRMPLHARKCALQLVFAVFPAAALAVYPNNGPDTTFSMVGQFGGASGVAIDPYWVLTAAHVDGSLFVLPGIGTYNVVQDVRNPTADLRLLEVDQPMPVYSRLDLQNDVGATVAFAGFGLTGLPRDDGTGFDMTGADGNRHTANNRIDYSLFIAETNSDGYWFTLDAPGTANAVAGEGGISFGDSGGGWFRQQGGSWLLVATNDTIDYAPGTTDFYTWGATGAGVLDASYADWIGGYVPAAVPEPLSIVVISGGLLSLLARRRRRSG